MAEVDVNSVWQRILALEGEEFRQKGGKVFTYSKVGPSTISLDTTNRTVSKSVVEDAVPHLPLSGPGQINHLQAPSYVYGILMDERVRGTAW